MEWCVECGEWHCFDCVEPYCCDSDREEEFNRHVQASYKKFGKDVVNRER